MIWNAIKAAFAGMFQGSLQSSACRTRRNSAGGKVTNEVLKNNLKEKTHEAELFEVPESVVLDNLYKHAGK